jgi:hypothetical protein
MTSKNAANPAAASSVFGCLIILPIAAPTNTAPNVPNRLLALSSRSGLISFRESDAQRTVSIGDASKTPVSSKNAVDIRSRVTERAITSKHHRIEPRYAIPSRMAGKDRTGGRSVGVPPWDAEIVSSANPRKRFRRESTNASTEAPMRDHIADV